MVERRYLVGVLWNPSVNKYRIYRFNLAAQSWVDVGPDVDDRSQSLADALWDGQKLYIASHVYSGGSQTSGNASAANSARLYRYSYNAVTDAYSLDAPPGGVLINSAICEALVIDKDSRGRLWATWTQSSKVYLNRSLSNDLTWGTPFALPTQGSNLSSDDISTLMAYDGKIGVVWSNQSDEKIYFSFHHDDKADLDWEPREIALSDPSLGAVADDHINMKMTNDSGGNLYITSKTSLSGSSNPGIYLLKRSFSGAWSKYVVATKADDYTRPIVVIDDENRELYVIGKSGSNIYKKKTSLDNIDFPAGAGDPFIRSSSADINDATVSKHNVNGTTGLLVLASDEENRYYYHNYLALPSNGPPTQYTLTVNAAGAGNVTLNPPGGTYNAGTMVTLTATPNSGYQFSGWSGDLSGSANPATITMNGNKNVTATFTEIPSGSSIVHEESKTGGASGSTTVTTSTSLTGVSGQLYLAAISTRPKKLVQSVTGLGLNWTLVKSICSGNNSTTGMEVWMAQGIPQGGSDGAVTATFWSAPSTAVIAVSRYSGVAAANPIGNLIAGNTNGLNGACTGGVDGNAYAFNLTTTVNGALIYGAVAIKARTHTPGAGYTEQVEFQYPHAVNPIGVAIEDKSVASASTVTVNGSFNGPVDWALVALEIKPATISTSGPIVHEESQTGGSSGSATVATSASLTGVSDNLYLAAISTQPRVGVVAVSGLGLSWTFVRKQCAALNSTGIEVWMAQGIPQGGSNGVVAATLASAPKATVIAVSRYSGVDATAPIGDVISGNTNGMNASATCAGGVPSDSYSFNLTTTANNAVVYSAAAMKARTHTPGAGYTERAEIKQVGGGLTSSVAVEDMTVAAAGTPQGGVNGSFSGTADWAEVALAIKPQLSVSKPAAGEPMTAGSPQPTSFQLEQNYPNPFSSGARSPAKGGGNPGTSIRYSLPQAGEVRVTIYNIYGQTVSMPVNGFQSAGIYTFAWQAVDAQGRSLPSGVYFYRLEAGSNVVTRRMTLLR